jgi:hypothetical protein
MGDFIRCCVRHIPLAPVGAYIVLSNATSNGMS